MDSYKALIDNLVTAIVVLGTDLRISFINNAAENLLQTSHSQATGQQLHELILHADELVPSLEAALANRQPYTEREITIRLPDNIIQKVDFTVTLLESKDATSALLIELQPLNRLQRINKDDESVTRQNIARQLIRGLAHEVKNPLGGIRGAAQLLERELTLDSQKDYTGIIISEVDRLKILVDRMLGPNQQQYIAPLNILKVLEHIIQLVEAEEPSRITWRRDYDPSLPDISADEDQLKQAIMNIVRNACEATAQLEQPRITLRSRVCRQFTIGNIRHRLVMHLDIIDNGPGIDPELEERLFFPMISGRANGTGLGLAITQNIIAQHQGSIQVASKPGNTCFSIYLPFTSHTQNNEGIHQP
ncbi:MAG: PAS domain-containing protein [Gammaproteobacteria bacterium]|nr:PAS domain-containing protein [Gammaproteobacteria bacterium]